MKTLVLYSGSIDSLVALGNTFTPSMINQVPAEVFVMVFDYGQKNITKFEYALQVLEHYKIDTDHYLINNVIAETYHPDKDFRLLQMLVTAVGYAVNKGIQQIVIGTNNDEYYKLNFGIVEEAVDSVIDDLLVNGPSILFKNYHNEQWENIELGNKLNVPFELCMTCDEGVYPFCGKCMSCSKRMESFTLAGVKDTALYVV